MILPLKCNLLTLSWKENILSEKEKGGEDGNIRRTRGLEVKVTVWVLTDLSTKQEKSGL